MTGSLKTAEEEAPEAPDTSGTRAPTITDRIYRNPVLGPLGALIILITHHETIHIELDVVAAAGSSHQTRHGMPGSVEVSDDDRTDKSGNAGQCNPHLNAPKSKKGRGQPIPARQSQCTEPMEFGRACER